MPKSRPILAVFGGAFDPYTKHHQAVVDHLIATGLADRVCIVPADVHRVKDISTGLDRRAHMIQLHLQYSRIDAASGSSHGAVAVDIGLPCYLRGPDTAAEYMGSSLELLRAAKAKYPLHDVALVIGEDCLGTISTWHRYKELRQEARFLVLPRAGYPAAKKPRGLDMTMVTGFDSRGSSTEARRALIHKDLTAATSLMCSASVEYAIREGLYSVPLSTGGPTLLADCTNYDDSGYKKAMNTVDTAIVRKKGSTLEVLLIQRKWNPYQGKWALPGGFVDLAKNETLAGASERELLEETGASGVPVKQLGTYGDPGRDPRGRVISVAYYALVPECAMDGQKLSAMDDASGVQWRTLHEGMRVDDLAFDHATILMDLLRHLRTLSRSTSLPFDLVDKSCFTWKELESSYEALLGRKVGNLGRKVLLRYNLAPSKVSSRERGGPAAGRGRPAATFTFLGEKDPF